ncbi:MAG: DUF116 domain-containing protein [Candidatus Ranarchaeia archaeon]
MSQLAKRIIIKAARMGLDLNVKDNLKMIVKTLGIDPKHVDQIWTELLNELNRKKFGATKVEERIILLPQCLRDSSKCTAKLSKLGFICNKCSAKCTVYRITQEAKALGYKGVYVSPGGSMAMNIVLMTRPKAVIAVACARELEEAISIARERGLDQVIPSQVVPLSKEGCIDTIVDEDKLLKIMRSGLKKRPKK